MVESSLSKFLFNSKMSFSVSACMFAVKLTNSCHFWKSPGKDKSSINVQVIVGCINKTLHNFYRAKGVTGFGFKMSYIFRRNSHKFGRIKIRFNFHPSCFVLKEVLHYEKQTNKFALVKLKDSLPNLQTRELSKMYANFSASKCSQTNKASKLPNCLKV